jgi:hypothetical protein
MNWILLADSSHCRDLSYLETLLSLTPSTHPPEKTQELQKNDSPKYSFSNIQLYNYTRDIRDELSIFKLATACRCYIVGFSCEAFDSSKTSFPVLVPFPTE